MNAFVQRLGCTCSLLLRLQDRCCNQSRYVNILSRHKFNVFTRGCSVLTVQNRDVDVDYDGEVTVVDRKKENEFARNLFHNSFKYAKSVMQPNTAHAYIANETALQLLEQDWTLMTDREMVSAVKKLSYNVRYDDEIIEPYRYKDAMEALCVRCEKLSNDDVMVIIRHLVPLRQRLLECSFYDSLCDQLDNECVKRFTQLPINDMLVLCDTYYELIHRSNSQYIWYTVRKLGNKPGKLAPHHLVQVLFFLNVCRKPPINMYELEYRLEKYLDSLTINEVGIAMLGFFKTGTPIRSSRLLNRLMTKTMADIDLVDSVSVGGIAKLIRYSMQLREINTLAEFVNMLKQHEPRFTLMTLTHIAHACARVSLYDKEFMDRLAKRLNKELKSARLKDFERLMFIFASFNIDSSNSIYHNVIEELRSSWDTSRAQEISQYPHVVSRIFGFMSYVNIYPLDLIKRIMVPAYVHKVSCGNYHYITREYCVLDYSLRVEVPEYDGPFLNPDICSFVAKKYFLASKNPDSCRANLLLTSVLKTCQELFNNTSDVTIDRVLPHYATADIILCLDEQNQLVPSEKYLSEFASGEIKRVDREDAKKGKWIALIMVIDGLLIRGTDRPVGHLTARIRQLSAIGYTPIMVIQDSWNKYKSQQERCDYIRSLILKNNVKKVTNS